MRLSEIEWQDIELIPAENIRGSETPAEVIEGLLSVGRPFVADAVQLARIGGKPLEPEMKLTMRDSDFPYIKLPISIKKKDKFDLTFLGVDVYLESRNDEAICWSMDPLRIEQEVKLKTESNFTSGLKLQGVELGGSDSESEEVIVYQPHIEGYGVGQTDPGWEFRPAKGRHLGGVYLLHLVVQMPKQASCTAKVKIKADINERGILFNYKALSKNKELDIHSIRLG